MKSHNLSGRICDAYAAAYSWPNPHKMVMRRASPTKMKKKKKKKYICIYIRVCAGLAHAKADTLKKKVGVGPKADA